jgi:hypothetical protein
MPPKNSKQLLCGLFYGEIGADLEVKMVVTYERSGKGDVKMIEVEGKRDKGKEVIVRYGIVLPKWKTWNYNDFSREWNKTYFTQKRK